MVYPTFDGIPPAAYNNAPARPEGDKDPRDTGQHPCNVLRLLATLGAVLVGSPTMGSYPVPDAAAILEAAFSMQSAFIAKVVLARKLAVDKQFDPPAQTAPMLLAKEDLATLSAKSALKKQLGKGDYHKGKGRDRYQPYRGNGKVKGKGKGKGKVKGPSRHFPASRQATDVP